MVVLKAFLILLIVVFGLILLLMIRDILRNPDSKKPDQKKPPANEPQKENTLATPLIPPEATDQYHTHGVNPTGSGQRTFESINDSRVGQPKKMNPSDYFFDLDGDDTSQPKRESARLGETADSTVARISNTEKREPKQKIIINSKSEYEPEIIAEPRNFSGKTPNPRNDKRRYLFLTKEAYSKIQSSIYWGDMRSKKNRVEQAGVLLGRVNKYKNEIYTDVYDTLLANTRGNPVFVEFTNEMWADMQDGLADVNLNRSSGDKLIIVGWFHTHPNDLSVFMSGTDKRTQRLNFSQEWQSSLVLNPHMRKHRAFFGAESEEGRIVVI